MDTIEITVRVNKVNAERVKELIRRSRPTPTERYPPSFLTGARDGAIPSPFLS